MDHRPWTIEERGEKLSGERIVNSIVFMTYSLSEGFHYE